MKFILNSRPVNFLLRSMGIRFKLGGISPGPTPPVIVCEVTWTDDTCLMWDDGTFAEYQ